VSTDSWWLFSQEKLFKEFSTSLKGLSSSEATIRHSQVGDNSLAQKEHHSLVTILISQFTNGMVLVLVIACIIAASIGAWSDLIALALITLINGVIGTFQEYRAEQSLQALRKLTTPFANVRRDGVVTSLATKDLVPGDVVELQAGDVVPADGRMLISFELSVDEAVLTGESIPVIKTSHELTHGTYALAEQKNMLFMATHIVQGRGTMLVTETGSQTQFGKIATHLSEVAEPTTQLNKQLSQVGLVLMGIACLIVTLTVGIGVFQGMPLLALVYGSLSLFIAAVPEGLPTIITVALSRAVNRMAQRNVLVRRLAAVESLGSISVICTDKTGTLTQNRMVVTHVLAGHSTYTVTGMGIEAVGEILKQGTNTRLEDEPDLSLLLLCGVLCNGAELVHQEGHWRLLGDPTEGALLSLAGKKSLYKSELEAYHRLVAEYPFDSTRKRMSILREYQGEKRLYVKGGLDGILARSTHLLINGEVKLMTHEERTRIEAINAHYTEQALRVIAGAYRTCEGSSCSGSHEDEQQLVFIGVFAMSDPPRPEAQGAVQEAHAAGIRTMMITGDHKGTATSIGLAIGLYREGDTVLTGTDIDTLSDEELSSMLRTTSICARVTVEHKIRIVRLLQEAGERVAMTGDGVNDAPALKTANMGIAMGITGTDVAKEASDIIITDDNYASIIAAIREGRGMYESLQKFVQYLLSSNLAEILVVLMGSVYASVMFSDSSLVVLMPLQLLWVNLVSDGLPALALVFDPLHRNLMTKKPSDFVDSLVAPPLLLRMGTVGLLLSFGVISSFLYGFSHSLELGQTMAFTTLVILEFIRLASVRASYGLTLFSNPLVVFAVGSSLCLQLLILYIPSFQAIFATVPLNLTDWGVVILIAVCTGLINHLTKNVIIRKS